MSECWICDRQSVPVCRECIGMLYNGAASADKERAAIVAWLRGYIMQETDIADAIEAGEHLKEKP